MMRVEIKQIHDRLDSVEEGTQRGQPQNAHNVPRRERVQPRGVRAEDEESFGQGFDEEDDQVSIIKNRRYNGRIKEARNQEDNNLGSIKIQISSFQGKNDPEAYLEWERDGIGV